MFERVVTHVLLVHQLSDGRIQAVTISALENVNECLTVVVIKFGPVRTVIQQNRVDLDQVLELSDGLRPIHVSTE
jgi:hypothetical protein